MFNRNFIVSALVATFMVVVDANLLIENSTDVKPFIEKITGGTGIRIREVPYQVYLIGQGCGGSIISPTHILTAAHCVDEVQHDPGFIAVRSGSADSQSGGVITSVSKIIVHEKYSGAPSHNNDIALLVLKTPLDYNANTQQIDLLTRIPNRGEEGYISGWGATDSSNNPTEYLRGATVQVTDRYTCNRHYWNNKGAFCAFAYQGHERNVCQGDSGGPIKVDGKLAGIASRGAPSCNSGWRMPALFTSVYYHSKWLEQKMKQDSEGDNEKISTPNPNPANPEVGNGASIKDIAANVVDFLKDLFEKH